LELVPTLDFRISGQISGISRILGQVLGISEILRIKSIPTVLGPISSIQSLVSGILAI